MISALPGFEYFSLAMSIANVGYAWGCIGADIWNLGNIYDDIYAVYGKKSAGTHSGSNRIINWEIAKYRLKERSACLTLYFTVFFIQPLGFS